MGQSWLSGAAAKSPTQSEPEVVRLGSNWSEEAGPKTLTFPSPLQQALDVTPISHIASLPVEIVSQILALIDREDLLSTAVLSKHWRGPSQAIMFQDVDLGQQPAAQHRAWLSSPARREHPVRRLVLGDVKADLVKEMLLACAGVRDLELSLAEEELEWEILSLPALKGPSHARQPLVALRQVLIFNRFTDLQALSFWGLESFSCPLRPSAPLPFHLDRLSLQIIFDFPSQADLIKTLLASSPHLSTLSLAVLPSPEVDTFLLPLLSFLPPTISQLELPGPAASETLLAGLLAALPSLKLVILVGRRSNVLAIIHRIGPCLPSSVKALSITSTATDLGAIGDAIWNHVLADRRAEGLERIDFPTIRRSESGVRGPAWAGFAARCRARGVTLTFVDGFL